MVMADADDTDSSGTTGVIVGSVVAGVVLIVLAVCVTVVLCFNRR